MGIKNKTLDELLEIHCTAASAAIEATEILADAKHMLLCEIVKQQRFEFLTIKQSALDKFYPEHSF